MSPRKVAIYLVLFLALGTYFYFYEVVGTRKKAEEQREAKRLFKFEAPDLSQILLKRDGSEIELKKGAGGWELIRPIGSPADNFESDSLIQGLTSIMVEDEVAGPKELAQFGLNKPSLTLEFTAKSAKQTLLVGSSAPVGDLRYVMRGGEKKVLLVKSFALNPLEKNLYQLRDKSLFTLKADEVEKLRIKRRAGTISLVKEKEKWTAPARAGFRVRDEKVSELVEFLEYIRAAKFLDGEKPNKHGLMHPEVVVELEGKGRVERLALGDKDKQGLRYGSASIRPGVVLVAKRDYLRLPGSLEKLEDRTFIAFPDDDVQAVKFTLRDGSEQLYERGQESWKSPGGKSLDKWALSALFLRLKDLEFSEKLKHAPGGEKLLAATLLGKDKKELLSVAFHREGETHIAALKDAAYSIKGEDGRLMVQWLTSILKERKAKPGEPSG